METVARAFEPYRHLDPIGWVGLYRFLPPLVGLGVAVLGGLALLFGGRRLFRLVAGPIGALIAAMWAGLLAAKLGFGASQRAVSIVSAFALFGAGLLFPQVVLFFALGVPAGLLAGELAGQADWLLGFAPGLMVGGALGVVLHRVIAAVLSSALGAWALLIGTLAALAPYASWVERLAASPRWALGIAGALACLGAAYQLFVRPSVEELDRRRHERASSRRREKETAQVGHRWWKPGKKA